MRYFQLAFQRIGNVPVGGANIGFIARWTLRRIFLAIGIVIVAVGLVLTPLPIPVGIPLMVLGAVITVNSSTTAKRMFLRWLRRRPGVTRRLSQTIGRAARRRAEARRRQDVGDF